MRYSFFLFDYIFEYIRLQDKRKILKHALSTIEGRSCIYDAMIDEFIYQIHNFKPSKEKELVRNAFRISAPNANQFGLTYLSAGYNFPFRTQLLEWINNPKRKPQDFIKLGSEESWLQLWIKIIKS